MAQRMNYRAVPRSSTAPGPGVCEWSPEGLHDKGVSLIPNTDTILKLVKKKINKSYSTWSTPRPGAVEGLGSAPQPRPSLSATSIVKCALQIKKTSACSKRDANPGPFEHYASAFH